MTGLMRSTSSPSSSIMRRSTPCVDGCCGPMLMIIVSPSSSSGHMPPPVSTTSRVRDALAQLLRALVGLALEALLFGSSCIVHRGTRVAFERHRDTRGRVVLAQRVAVPVVGHEDAREVGMAVEVDAEEVEGLALGEVRARVHAGERRHRRIVGRAPAQMTRMRRLRACDRKLATTSKRSSARRRRACGATPSSRWSTAVTSTHIVNCCSSRRNARHVGEHRAVDVHDRLAVAARPRSRPGNRSTIAAATSSVGRGRRRGRLGLFVIFFTSVVVGHPSSPLDRSLRSPAGTRLAARGRSPAPPGRATPRAGATTRPYGSGRAA